MDHYCPTCGCHCADTESLTVPPQPPVGTWVRDRFGAAHVRQSDGWSSGPGFYGFGRWSAMWIARGPLIVCGPHGADREGS